MHVVNDQALGDSVDKKDKRVSVTDSGILVILSVNLELYTSYLD